MSDKGLHELMRGVIRWLEGEFKRQSAEREAIMAIGLQLIAEGGHHLSASLAKDDDRPFAVVDCNGTWRYLSFNGYGDGAELTIDLQTGKLPHANAMGVAFLDIEAANGRNLLDLSWVRARLEAVFAEYERRLVGSTR